MDYANVKLDELPKKLLEKHKRMLTESKTTYKNIGSIKILEEKLDQLSHWVDESKGKKRDAYTKRRDAVQAELEKLRGQTTPLSKLSAKDLEKKISEHEQAIEYWKTR